MVSFWWNSKVIAELILIIYTILRQNPLLYPIEAQILVVIGGIINIGHFCVLKKYVPCMKHPSVLITNKAMFKWIRHPMYLGEILIAGGFLLILQDIVTICLFIIACVSLFGQALHEDKLLEEKFGNIYREWKKNTKIIIPYLL